ncbi:MAG: 4Fe-4S dicluster domain-containing protein [Methanobacterium sp.]|uniref:ferredoxin:CoB-CoM heterodisulfide reductase subunit HdrC n=1 Tax=Methanobacterium sp. TaxID=2164 RepID=UPI003D65F334|nr:4Fe-4S dicluster domain-containing protein [Methanobacterium sp.]
MNTLKIGENTFKLAESVINDLKASENLGILKCIQCGMCTSVCPAARHTDYDPRELVKRVLDKDENLISDDIIWDCFYCYTCHSVCPVNNSPCEINQIIRQKSIDNGKGKLKIALFSAYGESFLELGLGSIPSDFFDEIVKDFGKEWLQLKVDIEDIRENLDLGSMFLPEKDINEINKILDKTGFKNRLNKIKRCKDEENTR